MNKGLDAAKQRLGAFAGALGALGGALALGFATAKITGWLQAFADSGNEIFVMARTAGIGTAELYKLKGAVNSLGGDLGETVASMRKMSIFLHEVETGSAAARDAMTQLGLSISDFAGLSETEKLEKIGAALGAIASHETQAALGRQIFGRGGAATAAIAPQLAAARAATADPDMSDEQIAAKIQRARNLSMALTALERAKKKAFEGVGDALAPALTLAYKAVTGVVKSFRTWLLANEELIQKFALLGSSLVAVGTSILAIGVIGKAAAFAWGGFTTVASAMWTLAKVTSVSYWAFLALSKSLVIFRAVGTATIATISAVKSGLLVANVAWWLFTVSATAATAPLSIIPVLVGALVAGLAALGVYLFSQSATAQSWASSLTAGFMRVKDVFNRAFTGIKDAIAAGDLAGAFEIGFTGMKLIASEFNDWFGAQFGTSITDAFANMRIVFAETAAFIQSVWAIVFNDISADFRGLLTAVARWAPGVGGYATSVLNGLNNQQRPTGVNPLAAQLAQIEADRTAGIARANAGRPGGNLTSELQQELDNLNAIAAGSADYARSMAETAGDQIAPGMEGLGGGVARSTFNRDVLFGFGGSPVQQLITNTARMIELLTSVNEGVWDFNYVSAEVG